MPTAVEYHLKIDGITPSNSAGIPIESYSFGLTAPSGGSTGAGAGKVTFNPFSITKKVDKASPVLFEAAATGAHINTVVLTLLPAVQKSQIVYTFTDVFITEINDAGNIHGGAVPDEEVKFIFQHFQISVDGVRYPKALG